MAETINCPACGTRQSLDARFCSNCGAALIPATGPTSRLAGKACPNCQTPLPERAEFCTECGQRVGDQSALYTQPQPRAYAQSRPGNRSMMCPTCRDVALQMADRQGIEIEYCPACRGVWLDRGELDKIIERTAQTQNRSTRHPSQHQDRDYPASSQHRYDDDYRRKKKRGGFLDELFDFD
ncbi:MAG TPA: zf-TFIIB domain-containing protein [Herpetosiphonaceae bacterium]